MAKRRFRLRNLEVDRVDLVDKGANQYADIVIAKSDDGDEKRESIAAKMKDGYPVDSQLKNGPPPNIRRKRPKKKKKKGSAFPERNAAESSSAAPPVAPPPAKPNPFAKHNGPGNHASGSSQDAHGKGGGGKKPSESVRTGTNSVNFGDSNLGSSKSKTSGSSAGRMVPPGSRSGAKHPSESPVLLPGRDTPDFKEPRYDPRKHQGPPPETKVGRNFQRMSLRDLASERHKVQTWINNIIDKSPSAAYSRTSNNGEKVQRYMNEIKQINDEIANIREGKVRGSIRKALIEKHGGPGSHKSGSSQDVHGKGGGGGKKSGGRKPKVGSYRRGPDPNNLSVPGGPGYGELTREQRSAALVERTKARIAESRAKAGTGPKKGGGSTPPPEPKTPDKVESSGPRPIHEIADEIRRDWKKVNYAAAPYLDAMGSLSDMSDNYYQDSGSGVVAYFLSNAGSWRGDTARKVKKELKAMLKANKDGLSSTPGRGGPSFRKAFAAAAVAKPDPNAKDKLPTIAEAKGGKIPGQPKNPAPPKVEEGDASQTPTPGAPTPAAGQPNSEGLGVSPTPGAAPLGPGSAPGKRPVETPKAKPALAAAKPQAPVMDDKKKKLADQLKQKGAPPSGGKPF